MTGRFSGLVSQSGYAAHRWNYPSLAVGSKGGGVRGSTKRKYSEEEKKDAFALLDEGYTPVEVSRKLGIPKPTIETWKRRR